MTSSFLAGLALSGLVSAGLLAVGWRASEGRGALCSGAAALGLGYVLGHGIVVGWPRFPPADATSWLPWLALLALALGLRNALFRGPLRVRLTLQGALALAAVWLITRSLFNSSSFSIP